MADGVGQVDDGSRHPRTEAPRAPSVVGNELHGYRGTG